MKINQPFTSIISSLIYNIVALTGAQATAIMLGLNLYYISEYIHPVSAIVVGFIGTGYRIAEFIGDPTFGALSDKIGRKPLLIIGSLLSAVVVYFYSATTSLAAIFILLTIEGLSAAIRAPAMLSFLSDATGTSEKLRGRVMGFHQVTVLGGMVIGFAWGGWLWDSMGRSAFRIISILYLSGACIISLFVFERMRYEKPQKINIRGYWDLIVKPDTLKFLPSWLAMSAIFGAWISQAVFQLSGNSINTGQELVGNFSGETIGFIFAIAAIIIATGTISWGFLVGKFKTMTIMFFSSIGVYLICISLTLINHPMLTVKIGGNASQGISVILLALGLFIVSGFTPAAFTYLADLTDSIISERGIIVGVYYLFLSIGQLLGAWLGGVSAQILQIDGLILLTLGLVTINVASLISIRFSRSKNIV